MNLHQSPSFKTVGQCNRVKVLQVSVYIQNVRMYIQNVRMFIQNVRMYMRMC